MNELYFFWEIAKLQSIRLKVNLVKLNSDDMMIIN